MQRAAADAALDLAFTHLEPNFRVFTELPFTNAGGPVSCALLVVVFVCLRNACWCAGGWYVVNGEVNREGERDGGRLRRERSISSRALAGCCKTLCSATLAYD